MSATGNFFINLVYSMGPTITITTSCWLFIAALQKRLDWREKTFFRLIAEFLGVATIAIIVAYLFTYVNPMLNGKSSKELNGIFGTNVLFNLGITLFIVSLVEGAFFFSQWKESAVERERLQKEHFKSQFQNLKNQVNPHFLFNSLNALTGLIETNQTEAVEYVQDLSKYLRQILAQTDDEAIPLNDELSLLRNYYRLLKGRFLDKLLLDIDLQEVNNVLVAPLTLQMLVENAIKHNVIGGALPLEIRIYEEGDFLVVRNNKKSRLKPSESIGVGLENIKKRYEYLTTVSVRVIDGNGFFEVRIPKLTMLQQ